MHRRLALRSQNALPRAAHPSWPCIYIYTCHDIYTWYRMTKIIYAYLYTVYTLICRYDVYIYIYIAESTIYIQVVMFIHDIDMYIYIYVHMCVSMPMYINVYVYYTYIYVYSIYNCIYIYIYTRMFTIRIWYVLFSHIPTYLFSFIYIYTYLACIQSLELDHPSKAEAKRPRGSPNNATARHMENRRERFVLHDPKAVRGTFAE